jgi:endo-1,4-beta-xylanase
MRSAAFHLGGFITALVVIGCSGTDGGASPASGGAGSAAGAGGTATAGASHGGSKGTAGGAAAAGASHGGSTGSAGGTATAGASHGGSSGTGAGAGGTAAAGASQGGSSSVAGAAGASGHGGAAGAGPDCSATMPTGGTAKTGTDFGGNADGLAYALWTNGSGGTINVFDNAHAFSASWNNSSNFLANVGLNFGAGKKYADYGKILAQFVETKKGTDGGYSFIGIYGWTQNPCTEWYIVEDSYNAMPIMKGSLTATIDGGTYYMSTNQTTGSGGNACEAGHTGPWTQFWNVRSTARQCGTVTVSDHFDAWAKQGWTLGNLHYVHISLEVLGGTGEIDFPVANVTTSN